MTEELAHLWALRGLDESRGALRAALARFPAERVGLERRVSAERARLEALKTRLGEIQLKRRQLEKDIDKGKISVEREGRMVEIAFKADGERKVAIKVPVEPASVGTSGAVSDREKTYRDEVVGTFDAKRLGIDTNYRLLPLSASHSKSGTMEELGLFHSATLDGYYATFLR